VDVGWSSFLIVVLISDRSVTAGHLPLHAMASGIQGSPTMSHRKRGWSM
jgi:hypothetical protein